MKKYLRLSWGADSTPVRLLGAVVLSFVMMFFVNSTMGGFGGIQQFVAFAFVFFLVRAVFVSGNRINHFVGMSSKAELRHIYVSYAEGYILFYIVMKFVQVVGKIAGWGSVQGMTVQQYFRDLYGTTIVERWVYVFTCVFVITFVLSLFPLVVIKKAKSWIAYAVSNVAIHSLLVLAVVASCYPKIAPQHRKRVRCMLDALLLSKQRDYKIIALYLIALIVYVALAIWGSYRIAVLSYGPKPGKKVANPEDFVLLSEEEIIVLRKHNRKRGIIIGSSTFCAVALVVFGLAYYFFIQHDSQNRYVKVAEWLTDDYTLGPIRYGGSVYIPVNTELDLNETGKAIGYLGKTDELCTSRYYRLVVSNILYKSKDNTNLYLQVYGSEKHAYLPVSFLETHKLWENDSIFFLWDEDWKGESAYTKDVTGYSVCPIELIEALEEEFATVNYRPEDFSDYDAYFTLCGYKDLQSAVGDEAYPGDWVGCILVKGQKFYYGSYENEITGETLEMLKVVLGGSNQEQLPAEDDSTETQETESTEGQ